MADGIAVMSLVAECDSAWFEPVEQRQLCRGIMGLPRRRPEPERPALPVDDRVDLGSELAP